MTQERSDVATCCEPSASGQTRGDYYPWFDWLRAVLAIVVMLYHDGLIDWKLSGNFAVQVFFALSGWLIGGMLLTLARSDLYRFYFNRAIRIWVPYYIAVALLLTASLLREPVTLKWLEIAFYKLTFVFNLFGSSQLATYIKAMPLNGTGAHLWSINAEEQFYLLAPLLLVIAAPAFGRSLLTWLALAALSWYAEYYAAIVFGVAAAVAARDFGEFYLGRVAVLVLLLVAAGGSVAMALGVPYPRTAPFVAIAIVLLLARRGAQVPLGKLLGGMSYQLYLNHWIGRFAAAAMLGHFGMRESPWRHVLSSALGIGLATALYWYVDRPLLAHRGAWFTKSRGRVVAAVAYATVVLGLAGAWAFASLP